MCTGGEACVSKGPLQEPPVSYFTGQASGACETALTSCITCGAVRALWECASV